MDEEGRKALLALKDHTFFELISDMWLENDCMIASLAEMKDMVAGGLPLSGRGFIASCDSMEGSIQKTYQVLEEAMDEIHKISAQLDEDN